jgi:SAM-dependent methyltransferase
MHRYRRVGDSTSSINHQGGPPSLHYKENTLELLILSCELLCRSVGIGMNNSMTKDWNAAYEADETPWDKGFAAPPLRAFLETHPIRGRVLVPGCGLGHDVRLLAQQGASVVGLDIVPKAVRKAQAVASVGDERFEVADFLNLAEHYYGQFDVVVEHTCLCALDPTQREAYVRAVLQALKPGGHYLAVFFREVKDYRKGGPPHPITADQIEALFSNDFDTLESSVPQQSYPCRPLGSEEVRWMRKRSGNESL